MFIEVPLFLETSPALKNSWLRAFMPAPLFESLFNLEYCEIFKSSYFEEHLRTTAFENVFMKLRKSKDCS